ncbi:MAG: enoyl-CoA hydratase/isomerase family protein [Deltaproteobacteria bacterium]|nr:MAG: enoyl-CoA hydratase/isomerase family protein [Deltaproteobacteria bacterium]
METIRIERHGPVAQVVLCRPDIRNAFNDTMIKELRETFAELGEDGALRVVVLTGEGKAFCAGADLNWMRRVVDYTYEENLEDSLHLANLMREIYDFPRPVVGRINGPAIGGGTGLVAVCDITVTVDTAIFAFSEVKLGLVPACISPYVLKRLGERYGREYFLTGERLSAQRALECGLVNRVATADELDQVVQGYVDQLLTSGPDALATCKRMVQVVGDLSLDEAGPFTADMIARLRMGEEGQEGMAAFLQRRKPSWVPKGDD